jgi:hypothetical protein
MTAGAKQTRELRAACWATLVRKVKCTRQCNACDHTSKINQFRGGLKNTKIALLPVPGRLNGFVNDFLVWSVDVGGLLDPEQFHGDTWVMLQRA